jgi:probable rRNA maturation factor
MTHHIVIQNVVNRKLCPKAALLRSWAAAALGVRQRPVEVTIRIVDMSEMTSLNETYRHKKGPTNVLSFPTDIPQEVLMDVDVLGDIVICAEVVINEAKDQQKSLEAHWAHMVIHGVFHLLGYDHELDSEAKQMEALEIAVMKKLQFDNPYNEER